VLGPLLAMVRSAARLGLGGYNHPAPGPLGADKWKPAKAMVVAVIAHCSGGAR
jgi:hypothetical protein